MAKVELIKLYPIEMHSEMACCIAHCIGATYDNVEVIANTLTNEEIEDCINLVRLNTGYNPNEINKNYKNFIEDLLEEKEALLKKYETKGAHALKVKALKSEIRRCKRVLEGKPYDRNYKK